jgi:glutamate synthase (NADPH/NADH) small chain
MGKITGFLEIDRQDRKYAPAADRVRHYKEFVIPLGDAATKNQAARCMNCGIPYCHTGCPVNNQIPDWNDLVYNEDWEEASRNLHSTNNFPEFTGRVCPAPCEESCTLNLEGTPVTIKTIECAIVDKAWEKGWIKPLIASDKTGKKVAIVFEKHAKAGGLLRYGIPDFKMEKHLIDRRIEQMEIEGVTFHYGAHIGVTQDAKQLIDSFDAVLLCAGSEKSRDLPIPGRDLQGIHFAMDFLPQQNRRVSKEPPLDNRPISAEGKHVVVIGGGDTGSDCIGTSIRQGARSVTQIEIMPKPPEKENKALVWPNWPMKLRTSSSHLEGAERDFAVATTAFDGKDGKVVALKCARAGSDFKPVPGTEFELKADLVLLAMGFVHPVHDGMVKSLGVKLDPRGNVEATVKDYKTSLDKLFAAGDARRGQSLVVWAIREGRQAARAVDEYLMGSTVLPR